MAVRRRHHLGSHSAGRHHSTEGSFRIKCPSTRRSTTPHQHDVWWWNYPPTSQKKEGGEGECQSITGGEKNTSSFTQQLTRRLDKSQCAGT